MEEGPVQRNEGFGPRWALEWGSLVDESRLWDREGEQDISGSFGDDGKGSLEVVDVTSMRI